MVEPASVSTLLPPLPAARPPTPPRESSHSESKTTGLIGRFFQKEPPSRRSSNTPNPTPESSAESPNQTAGASRKKVGFADWTDYNEPPEVSFDGKGQIKHTVQPLPPSAGRKPSKSILKVSNGIHEDDYSNLGSNTKLLPPHHHATFATMLESIVQQLAGKDRSSKQDAYLMLSGSLKASDNVPDMKALKEKMPLLCQFIWRDLSEKLENGNTDSTLVTKALVLLSSFLQKPVIADTFPAEFPMHIVDHTIKTLEEGSASKDIVKHLMFVMAQQNFSPKIMNQERTGRLITALYGIENHVKGKSIIMGRLDIYRTLLRQSKPHMLFNTLWVKDLFTDMLSSLREIRTPAILFGLEASFLLGREGIISRVVSSLFKIEQEDQSYGATFADYYAGRLREIVKNKDVSPTVPQIWSVIILFLRHKPQLLEQWPFLKPFLGVVQLCFNSSDSATKTEANYAWNRFIFAILPNEKTALSMRTFLSQPLVGQLKRNSRKATLSSVCYLLYYALRPNSTPAQLDMYWDEYVISIVGQCLVAGIRNDPDLVAKDAADACNLLHGLFDSTTPRPWTETRAMDTPQKFMEPKELPALDSKWLRKSFFRVFPVLSPLLEKLYWDIGEDSDVARLWEAYITSIASPMKMEVKVSIDAMGCVASLFSLLHKIWNTGPKGVGSFQPPNQPPLPQSTSAFLRSFEKLISTAIKGLGLLAFTEKLLCITQDTFVAIATPSQHPKKLRGVTKSPLHHLVLLLGSISPNLEYDERFSQMVYNILLPFCESRTTSKSKLEFLRDLLPLLPPEGTVPRKFIWEILADFATIAADTRDETDINRSISQPLGVDYRDVVKILGVGINISPDQPLSRWKILFRTLATSATIDAGEAGRAIAVVEPLANLFLPTTSRASNPVTGLSYLPILLGKAAYPKDRQALDAANRRIWGAGNAGPKTTTFDPYIQLYDYIKTSLVTGYDSFSKQSHHDYVDVMSSVTNLLSRCPIPSLLNALAKIQSGIASWIVDGGYKLIGGTALSQSVIALWSTVTKILPGLLKLHTHTKVLRELELLIYSGFESKHKSIINKTIQLWNSMFGACKGGLEYPEQVKVSLLKLRQLNIDVQLPFFPESLESEEVVDQRQPSDYMDSQDESSNYSGFSSLELAFKQHLEPHLDPLAIRRIRQSTPQVIIEVGRTQSRKRSREATPESSNRKSRKRDVTPRLRHDDSQVQFEAIESSPMADRVVDSQLLTEKQKEIKERQQAEAAMFPDLRSNPMPKAKSVERSVEDPELPIHRSSSKLRAKLSPNVTRQTTPTLVLPSDDDNAVPSSPTPTRSLRGETQIPDPPSSPPEATTKSTACAEDIASSPLEGSPEPGEEPGNDAMTSVEPSAQVDSYAFEVNRTVPAFESMPVDRASSPVDPSAQLLTTDSEQQSRNAATEDDTGEQPVEVTSEPALESVTDPQLPETPPRNGTESPTAQQTPKTPQFVDALTSPASSDKLTINEDVFEDAVSSPRLNIVNTRLKQFSSPLSDGDDSSMLRLVAEYDQGSGRAGRNVSFVEDKENLPRQTRASSSKETSSLGNAAARKTTLRKQSVVQSEGEEPESTSELQKQSSDPSLIPETPAANPNESSTKEVIDGEEIDWDETIVVDTSSLETYDDLPIVKRGSARKKQLFTYSNKKRKHQFFAEDTSEVPDSQDVKAGVEKASPKKTSPSKKKHKGRPERASQVEQQIEVDVEVDQSQSLSVDLDAAMPDVNIEDNTTGAVSSSAKETTIDEGIDGTEEPYDERYENLPAPSDGSRAEEDTSMAGTEEDGLDIVAETAAQSIVTATADGGLNIAQTADESIDEAADTPDSSEVEPTSPDIERVEETVLNAGTFEKESSPAPELVDLENDSSVEIIPATTSEVIENLPPVVEHTFTEVPNIAEPEGPTIQSMKDKLQSLIDDMRGAALNRDELRELEDLFNDAKEQLYGAGRRGRTKVEMTM